MTITSPYVSENLVANVEEIFWIYLHFGGDGHEYWPEWLAVVPSFAAFLGHVYGGDGGYSVMPIVTFAADETANIPSNLMRALGTCFVGGNAHNPDFKIGCSECLERYKEFLGYIVAGMVGKRSV